MARKSTPEGFAEPKTSYGTPRSGGHWADEATHGKRKLPSPETLPDGTVRYFLIVGPKGRVLLPADLRAAMDLSEGDVLTAWLKDGEVRVHSHRRGLSTLQTEALSLARGNVYASDELITERRAEAARDAGEELPSRRGRKSRRR
ncbi:MAG: AbrB/MazE/SpoVT family DNA-binding domain-containing protein [Pseudolabrys sp.]|jgi:bifunctional DNA-binding transcriptional regulator/antitoxin component of YhaV-PrlF toxin-antitoxin module